MLERVAAAAASSGCSYLSSGRASAQDSRARARAIPQCGDRSHFPHRRICACNRAGTAPPEQGDAWAIGGQAQLTGKCACSGAALWELPVHQEEPARQAPGYGARYHRQLHSKPQPGQKRHGCQARRKQGAPDAGHPYIAHAPCNMPAVVLGNGVPGALVGYFPEQGELIDAFRRLGRFPRRSYRSRRRRGLLQA
jgi:hypothetical protein